MVSAHHFQTIVKFLCLSWFISVFVTGIFVLQLFVNTDHKHAKNKSLSYFEEQFLTISNMSEFRAEMIMKGMILEDEEVVNPHPFEFTIVEKDICNVKRPDIFILSVVHTHPANYKKRMHIRETWGNQRYYDRVHSVILFTMGITEDDKVEKAVQVESERYHDIIQENFLDTYKNLSYKGIMWLRWVSTYCPNALFVLKADDDMIVNIFNVASHLRNLYQRDVVRNQSILCLVWYGMPVIRVAHTKWYVSREEYANDTYPTYCSGSAYIITQDLIYSMYQKSYTTKFVWVDDAYITGILPLGLDFTHVDLSSLYVLRYEDIEEKLAAGYALFGHMPTSISFRSRLWKKVLSVRNLD